MVLSCKCHRGFTHGTPESSYIILIETKKGNNMKAAALQAGTVVLAASAAFLLGGCGPSVCAQLDRGPSTVFTSLAGCVATKGVDFCAKSYAAAAEHFRPDYDSQSDCALSHGEVCSSFRSYVDTSTVMYMPMGDGVPMPLLIPSGYYRTSWAPPMIGWQALETDPEIAAPVFPIRQSGFGRRGDGKVLQLPS